MYNSHYVCAQKKQFLMTFMEIVNDTIIIHKFLIPVIYCNCFFLTTWLNMEVILKKAEPERREVDVRKSRMRDRETDVGIKSDTNPSAFLPFSRAAVAASLLCFSSSLSFFTWACRKQTNPQLRKPYDSMCTVESHQWYVSKSSCLVMMYYPSNNTIYAVGLLTLVLSTNATLTLVCLFF